MIHRLRGNGAVAQTRSRRIRRVNSCPTIEALLETERLKGGAVKSGYAWLPMDKGGLAKRRYEADDAIPANRLRPQAQFVATDRCWQTGHSFSSTESGSP